MESNNTTTTQYKKQLLDDSDYLLLTEEEIKEKINLITSAINAMESQIFKYKKERQDLADGYIYDSDLKFTKPSWFKNTVKSVKIHNEHLSVLKFLLKNK